MRFTPAVSLILLALFACNEDSTAPEESGPVVKDVVWQQTSLDSMTIECILVSGSDLFVGTSWGSVGLSNGLFLSKDNGISWTSKGLDTLGITALRAVGSSLLAGGARITGFSNFGLGIFRSTDGGNNWTHTLHDSLWVVDFATNGTDVFAGTDFGVLRSTDNGASWTEVNNGLPTYTWVTSLAVSGTDIFAGTYGGGVFRSTDNGASWTAVNTGLPVMGDFSVTAYAVSGTSIFAGTSYGVFLSTDNGANWNEVSNGLPVLGRAQEYPRISALVIIGNSLAAGIYAGLMGLEDGVFLSTNNGKNWTAASSGMLNANVISFAVSGTNLFAGTSDGGVFRGTMQ